MLLISFTAQIRGENYILFGLFILGAFIFLRNIPCLKQNINIWFAVTVVCLCLPNFVSLIKWQFAQNWLLKETSGFVVGKNFSLQNLFINSFAYAPELLNGVLYPGLFIILFLIGFVYLWYRNRMFNLFLSLWFIVFYLIYFSAWSLRVQSSLMARSRFYIGFYPVFVIWCAGGILFFWNKIRNVQLKKIVTVILSSLLVAFFYPYDKKLEAPPDYKHILQTEIIEKAERELPGNCLIVCNYPEVLGSTTFLKIINIKDFLENDDLRDKVFHQFDCVLFFEDLYCFDYEDTKKNCEKMKSIVRLKPFKSYSIGREGDPGRAEYTFYKISPGD
jgi:type IV secretory pathway VirB3-like protein